MILERLYKWATYFIMMIFAGLFVLLSSLPSGKVQDELNNQWFR